MSVGSILNIQGKQRREANEFWLKVAMQLNSGMTPQEVADSHINPKTNKPYTREHIYWIIRQLKKGLIQK